MAAGVGELAWSDVYQAIDSISTVSAVPLALVGFGVAYRQLKKTRTAAEAARDAARGARRDASRAGILVLLPQLQRIEEQLDRAVEANSVELVTSWANNWRWQASELNGHLKNVDSDGHTNLPPLLQSSVQAAAALKKTLTAGPVADLRKSSGSMRDKVTAVTNELGAMMVHYTNMPEGDRNDT